MPYALYIDESGNFKENNMTDSGRTSIVGGWMAKNDDDHDRLRQQLNQWYRSIADLLSEKAFHATEWRKHEQGRLILNQVLPLTNDLKPHSIIFMENRSTNLPEQADSTYLDMLVELIVTTIFSLLESRRDRDAFPLQIYVAERKGVPQWEITKLVQYRLRAVLNGSEFHHKITPQKICTVHIKKLKKSPELINNAQSRSRDKMGLMPELILADFICNSLYQLDILQQKPKTLTACEWRPSMYIPDPFWNDLNTFRNQKRWVEIFLAMVSVQGEEWAANNKAMLTAYSDFLDETIVHIITNLPAIQTLIASLSRIIHQSRDFIHATAIINILEKNLDRTPSHLAQTLVWNLSTFRLSIANHQGDNKSAADCFENFIRLFENPSYQRTEFFQSVADNYNRHAVAMTDRYKFDKAEALLKDAIAVEKVFLSTSFEIDNRTFNAQKSDNLGKIYSTLGQLYSKQAYRKSSKAAEALACFAQAKNHMQQSLDPPRQRNYTIEALLVSRQADKAAAIYQLLSNGATLSPEALFLNIGYNSFDTLYWLRWMVLPNNTVATPYKKELIKHHLTQLLETVNNGYPGMSIHYYVGQLAWAYNKKSAAIRAWNLAAGQGRDIKYAGVLQTLALRPLCKLILHNLGDDVALAADTASLKSILSKIKSGGSINAEYFKDYFLMLDADDLPRDLLEQLQKDIPYC